MIAFGSLGFGEILLIAAFAVVLWGPDLPKVMREVGRGYARLRRHLWDLRYEIERAAEEEEERARAAPAAVPPPALPAAPGVPNDQPAHAPDETPPRASELNRQTASPQD
jgi:Sec-independent protein translocase protein TatA